MLVSDILQMRQSEGNKTAKRLSPTWLAQVRGLCKTIEVPASGTVARLARILSSLLLKTASNYAARSRLPCAKTHTFELRYTCSIAASPAARQRYVYGTRAWAPWQRESYR